MIRTDLGRRLRELNVAALPPTQKIELNDRERATLIALSSDRGWSEFVRRWRRRETR